MQRISKINSITSFNFSLAKVVAILLVVTGHWFDGLGLWMPITVGLFIFGFSSTYFTALNEGVQVNLKAFWKKKLERLGVRYWFLLAMISVFVLIKGGVIFHWHTLVHMFALSGVLNLVGHSESGLGRGLWFFTNIVVFYAAYPYLAKLFTRSPIMAVSIMVALALVLNQIHEPGYALWLATAGFILGVQLGINPLKVSDRTLWMGFAVVVAMIGVTNGVFHVKIFNKVFMFMLCLSVVLILTQVHLPQWRALKLLAANEKVLLEVFLVHSYLFVHPTGHSVVDFVISSALILVAAHALNHVGNLVVAWVFHKPKSSTLVA